jgi:alpha-tubulin suppressor-like RCC1 family protein
MKTKIKVLSCLLIIMSVSIAKSQCWTNLRAGFHGSHGIKNDGTIWGWGRNSVGQIGDGTESLFIQTPTKINNYTDWKSISSSTQTHCLALKQNGSLWAWGSNFYGEIGDGNSYFKRLIPVQIGSETNWKTIDGNDGNSFAIKQDGTLWAWGLNNVGQLGDGTLINRYVPTQVGTDSDWLIVSAGGSFTRAIKQNGTLWGWGGSDVANLLVPTQIGTDNDWSKLSAGDNHTLAIKTDRTLWAWGSNVHGQIGDNVSSIYVTNPKKIGTENTWQKISAGSSFSLAIKQNGTLWVWGTSSRGVLGLGSGANAASRYVPTQQGSDNTWENIFGGWRHSLSLKNNNKLWAWGDNISGALGEVTTLGAEVHLPISVGGCSDSNPTLDTQSFNNVDFITYPNPVTNILNLSYTENISSVSIYNLLGQQMLKKSINEKESKIDMSQFSNGTYIIKVIVDSLEKNIKIIKQ